MVQLECYHGTSYENAQHILMEKRFLPSRDKEGLRLGEGAYFFCRGGLEEYAIDCARQLELFHGEVGKHKGEYAILSCLVECKDDELFDMYDPAAMEVFHKMRHYLYSQHLNKDPDFTFQSAAAADTETINYIRRSSNISVVKCPQFFGMLSKEKHFYFSKGARQFPKTFVPNVIIACVDTQKVRIRDIRLIDKGVLQNGSSKAV